MNHDSYDRAIQIISNHADVDLDGPKSEDLVAKAEIALGLKFPPSYRRFLQDFGCGSIGSFEIYGLIDENFTSSTIPNGIWLTLTERRQIGLSKNYIIIGDGGDGSYIGIDVARINSAGESPVVSISVDGAYVEDIDNSFGRYLLSAVRNQCTPAAGSPHRCTSATQTAGGAAGPQSTERGFHGA